MAGIDIFSGRPNPMWPLSAAQTDELVQIWNDLERKATQRPEASPLGYRGCFLILEGNRWTAFRGVVTMEATDARESRVDATNAFEAALLRTAPPGTPSPLA